MKRVIIFVICYALCIAAAVAFGQDFKVKSSSGRGFDISTASTTGTYIKCGEKTFSIYVTPNGAQFVTGISAEGKPYPIWIGTKTGKKFQGNDVYQFKSGSYAYFILGKNGYPRAIYLEAN